VLASEIELSCALVACCDPVCMHWSYWASEPLQEAFVLFDHCLYSYLASCVSSNLCFLSVFLLKDENPLRG